jgi:hypothetical protein
VPPRIAAEYTPQRLAFDGSQHVETALPENIDSETEELAEHCCISLRAAGEALEWFKTREREEIHRYAGDLVKRIFSELIPLSGAIKPNVIGLRILGLDFLLNRRAETLTALAQRCGSSKQLLDHHVHWIGDRLNFHGFAQKRTEARATYAAAQRESWARLTPEERKARRAGKNAAQSATPNLTISQETECEHTSPPPNSLGL